MNPVSAHVLLLFVSNGGYSFFSNGTGGTESNGGIGPCLKAAPLKFPHIFLHFS